MRQRVRSMGWLAFAAMAATTDVARGGSSDPGAFFSPQVLYGTGSFPRSVAIGDLDRDGHADMAVANETVGIGTVSVLLNNAEGTFASQVLYDVGDQPRAVVIRDLDQDKYPNIVVANYNELGTISIFINNGDGTFKDDIYYGTQEYPISVAVGDLYGDRAADVVAASFSENGVKVLLNISPPPAFTGPDLDSDGVVNSLDLNEVLGYFNCPHGVFSILTDCPGDTDADGDTDSADLNAVLGAFGQGV